MNPTKYKVKPGDTLPSIARHHHVSVDALAHANGFSEDNHQVRPGQSLRIPVQNASKTQAGSLQPRSHRVRLHDRLPDIAQRYGVSVPDLMQANGITDHRLLWVGQELKLPIGSSSPLPVQQSLPLERDAPHTRAQAQQFKTQDNPYRNMTVEQRAAKLKSLLETSFKQFIIGTGSDILEVFQASESLGDFFTLQDSVDMEEVIDECAPWTAIRLGTMGPIQKGRDLLNEKRAGYIVDATHDYGHALAQIFILYMFNNMFGDDITATLKVLTRTKRLAQTLLKMPAVQESLKVRGIDLATYKDRDFKSTDIFRGIGSGLGDILSSGEAAKGATSSRYFGQKQTLPQEYQDVLSKIELAQLKEALTLKNLALGTFDYLTFGIPMGLYHLVVGTAHGLKELVVGDAEQGIEELVPALLLLVSYLGVKAYRPTPKKDIGTKNAALTNSKESSQFVLKGYSGPLSREAARLGAMLRLNGEAQGAVGLLLERYGQHGVRTLTHYIRADSKTVRFIHENGVRALDALLEAKGDIQTARGLMPPQPVKYLPAPRPPPSLKPGTKQPSIPTTESIPTKKKTPPTKSTGDLSTVKGWERFDPALNEAFRKHLQRFRGNTDLKAPPKGAFRGGEGQLFLSEQAPGRAIKRWFESRKADMAQSVKLLKDADASVQKKPPTQSGHRGGENPRTRT